jgi:hypothetical protein
LPRGAGQPGAGSETREPFSLDNRSWKNEVALSPQAWMNLTLGIIDLSITLAHSTLKEKDEIVIIS